MFGTAQSERQRTSTPRLRRFAFLVVALAALTAATQTLAGNGGGPSWNMIGNDSANSRNNPFESQISTANVSQLAPKWSLPSPIPGAPPNQFATTAGDVSGTPAVVGGAVYFGDFGGMEWKLDADTGQVIWSHPISYYTGISNDLARTSPIVAGNTLIIGSLQRPVMLGIDATTGELKWKTQVNPDTQASGHGIMTGSPVLAGDTVFTGVSASGAGGASATFRGNIAALNAQTGKLLWESFSVPDNGGHPGGYAGATMFSPPAVDIPDGLVIGTFGQPYTEPASVKACNAADPNGFNESCEQPGSFIHSIVAFDMKTGDPVWSYRVLGDAPWQRACGSQPATVTWCAAESNNPEHGGDAWDLGGSGANVFQIGSGKDKRTVVGVGEKSGVYVLLDAKTGAFVWNTLVGPGGDQGGFEWGTAYDGDRIYVSITNQHHIPYKLTENGTLAKTTVTGGSWAALDPETGKILWQTADPTVATRPGFSSPVGVWDLAPVTVANGVLYAASMAKKMEGDDMYALDAATGQILWSYNAGSSVNAAPAVANGSVYWGTGYSRSGVEGSGNTRLYAFSIGGN
jgi:polyvinyl alcohol dehydrogenase (cytochrome)